MADLFDLLINKGKNLGENVSNFYQKIVNRDVVTPKIEPVIQNPDGSENPIADLAYLNRITPLKGKEKLFGRTITKNIASSEPNKKGAYEMATISDFRPGFLNDLTSGYKENAEENFDIKNLANNKTSDKRYKGFGYRLGEALGTGARLLDNSLVRGALAYGLSKYNGDYNPLEQGLIALGTNMQNKTNDRLYRNDLALNGIDTSNIRGFIDNNTYGNLIRSQQIRDNAEWRKLQNETMQDMRNREFEYRKKQDAIENALRAKGIEIQENKANANKTNDSDVVIKQLEELMNLHSKLPQYKFDKGFQKGSALLTGGLSDIGLRTDEVAAYEGVQNMMINLIARKLAGEKGVMTDKDFDRAKKMVPNIYDSPQQAKSKYNALLTLYYANPTNLSQTNTQGKYKEGQTATNPQTGQKMIFRGGQWQIL